jgi:hypothetical protein
MKKAQQDPDEIDMRDEYDFSKGIRGKETNQLLWPDPMIATSVGGHLFYTIDFALGMRYAGSMNNRKE